MDLAIIISSDKSKILNFTKYIYFLKFQHFFLFSDSFPNMFRDRSKSGSGLNLPFTINILLPFVSMKVPLVATVSN